MQNSTIKTMQRELNQQWDKEIIPILKEYISIPNKSPIFDPDWEKNGYMQQAVNLLKTWCDKQPLKNKKVEVIKSKGRTPLLLIDVPGTGAGNILMYGHLDKQPEMQGWDKDLGPWKPVMRGNKLYGRGGADDGYSVFAALSSLAALQRHNIPHARCLVLIEASEESGSPDLPFYLKKLKQKIKTPDLIICLDSGAGNYNQLWATTSLRGIVGGTLDITVLKEGIHSGVGSGVVPSCNLVLRQLLERIEDSKTGKVKLKSCNIKIPADREKQIQKAARFLGKDFIKAYPWSGTTKPISSSINQLLRNRSWSAALSLTGIDGVPEIKTAGNVTLPTIRCKLSLRIPPTASTKKVAQELKTKLEKNPPFSAQVKFNTQDLGAGWNSPAMAPWLQKAANAASMKVFGNDLAFIGEGGSIPFMGQLGEEYPKAQFLILGILGPKSNAHGPNEFLHIPMVKKLSCALAYVVSEHYKK